MKGFINLANDDRIASVCARHLRLTWPSVDEPEKIKAGEVDHSRSDIMKTTITSDDGNDVHSVRMRYIVSRAHARAI